MRTTRFASALGALAALGSMSACSSVDPGDVSAIARSDAAPQRPATRFDEALACMDQQCADHGVSAPPAPGRPAPQPLRIDLFVSTSGAPGAPASVALSSSQAAFAYCYLHDVDGAIMQVFPNRWQPDALLRPNQKTEVPAPGAGFGIVLPDRGQERIVCFASTSEIAQGLPADLRARDLTPLPVHGIDELAALMRREAERRASELVVGTRLLRPQR